MLNRRKVKAEIGGKQWPVAGTEGKFYPHRKPLYFLRFVAHFWGNDETCDLNFSTLLAVLPPALAESAALKIFLVEQDVLCVRAGEISDKFAGQFRAAALTNQFHGLVLDLRQAGGDSEKNAADFLRAEKVPLVVLTDAQTRGAAGTLAEQLHSAGAVVIASGTNSPAKETADIHVPLSAEDEKRFLENPFTNSAIAAGNLSGTNLMFYIDHTSEAELVRKRVKDGEEDDTASPRTAPSQPVINDPALARAADLLKALSVLHRSRG